MAKRLVAAEILHSAPRPARVAIARWRGTPVLWYQPVIIRDAASAAVVPHLLAHAWHASTNWWGGRGRRRQRGGRRWRRWRQGSAVKPAAVEAKRLVAANILHSAPRPARVAIARWRGTPVLWYQPVIIRDAAIAVVVPHLLAHAWHACTSRCWRRDWLHFQRAVRHHGCIAVAETAYPTAATRKWGCALCSLLGLPVSFRPLLFAALRSSFCGCACI